MTVFRPAQLLIQLIWLGYLSGIIWIKQSAFKLFKLPVVQIPCLLTKPIKVDLDKFYTAVETEELVVVGDGFG